MKLTERELHAILTALAIGQLVQEKEGGEEAEIDSKIVLKFMEKLKEENSL